jgi:uncharacterized membrane protein YhaH (DUF805 family)
VINPYSAPAADLASHTGASGTYEPQAWSTSGRIGRVRFISYSYWISMAIVFVLSLVFGFLAASNSRLFVLQGLAYLPMLAVMFIMAIRRLHDLGRAGWWSLLLLVPLMNVLFGLWLMVWPGNKEENEYGLPPGPNTALVIAGAVIFPILFIGILAAVAIPAYQQYVERARAAQVAPGR